VSVPELWLRGFTVANRIVVLACPLTQEDQFYQVLTQQLCQVRQTLEEQYSILVNFGISQICPGVMGIPKAYAQAREVLDYRKMLGIDSCCLLWKDVSHGMSGKHGPIIGLDKERQILKCIEVGDYASMETQIRQLIDQEFEQAQPSIEIFRLRYYGLCNLLLNVMHEFVSVTGQRLDVAREAMNRVFQATNVAELKCAATEVLDQMVRQMQTDKQRAQPQWVVTMIDQIYQRYRDPNLSAAVLAAELHLNPTYAARIFKQHTGKGIYEYIHWVRIEAATILLKENVPVKSVAATVGYCDTASLSRVFKKYTGTTPSSYQPVRSGGIY
jgi:AraC-like DNA-binding protein